MPEKFKLFRKIFTPEFRYFPGWVGGGGGWWEEVIIKLIISAKVEAEALLGLAELGKI